MTAIRTITTGTTGFAVAGALAASDFARAAADGFKTIINFRPDGEAPAQMTAAEERDLALKHGLAYVHIPAAKYDVFTDPVVDSALGALAQAKGPVLAHCASGQRAVMIWAAACARQEPVDRVLHALKSADFDFGFLRDDLDAQADRARWRTPGPASQPATAHQDTLVAA